MGEKSCGFQKEVLRVIAACLTRNLPLRGQFTLCSSAPGKISNVEVLEERQE